MFNVAPQVPTTNAGLGYKLFEYKAISENYSTQLDNISTSFSYSTFYNYIAYEYDPIYNTDGWAIQSRRRITSQTGSPCTMRFYIQPYGINTTDLVTVKFGMFSPDFGLGFGYVNGIFSVFTQTGGQAMTMAVYCTSVGGASGTVVVNCGQYTQNLNATEVNGDTIYQAPLDSINGGGLYTDFIWEPIDNYVYMYRLSPNPFTGAFNVNTSGAAGYGFNQILYNSEIVPTTTWYNVAIPWWLDPAFAGRYTGAIMFEIQYLNQEGYYVWRTQDPETGDLVVLYGIYGGAALFPTGTLPFAYTVTSTAIPVTLQGFNMFGFEGWLFNPPLCDPFPNKYSEYYQATSSITDNTMMFAVYSNYFNIGSNYLTNRLMIKIISVYVAVTTAGTYIGECYYLYGPTNMTSPMTISTNNNAWFTYGTSATVSGPFGAPNTGNERFPILGGESMYIDYSNENILIGPGDIFAMATFNMVNSASSKINYIINYAIMGNS